MYTPNNFISSSTYECHVPVMISIKILYLLTCVKWLVRPELSNFYPFTSFIKWKHFSDQYATFMFQRRNYFNWQYKTWFYTQRKPPGLYVSIIKSGKSGHPFSERNPHGTEVIPCPRHSDILGTASVSGLFSYALLGTDGNEKRQTWAVDEAICVL